MKVSVVAIGNSRGVRIPKAVLEQCRIEDAVDLEVVDGRIVIAPVSQPPRTGWRETFKTMPGNGDDALLMEAHVDSTEDWEW